VTAEVGNAPNCYYLISHHNTILYEDPQSCQLRHAAFETAPLNLLLEFEDSRGRLCSRGRLSRELSSPAQPAGQLELRNGGVDFDCKIESFADDTVGIRVAGQYISADADGLVRNNRDWCRDWERYHLIRPDAIDGIGLLRRHLWLSHDIRDVLSLAPGAGEGKQPRNGEVFDLRREIDFGPARFRPTGRCASLLCESSGSAHGNLPQRLHIVGGQGAVHCFSRFQPLVYYCVYGSDSYFECLRLSLLSLEAHGRYDGTVGVACDRTANDIMKYVPKAFQDRLIVSPASNGRGYFNRYYVDHGLYDDYQPILYVDIDVIFDCPVTDLLIEILLQRQVCCATETRGLEGLVGRSPRDWPDYPGNYFGRWLYAADSEFPATAALGNSGEIGFDSIARVRTVNELVIAVARRQTPQLLKIFGDQPILNYVLHKTGLGNHELLDRYRRLARRLEDAPPEERRGLVHFYLASGAEDVSAKSSMMAAYLESLDRSKVT
jgi:hypothetical protein